MEVLMNNFKRGLFSYVRSAVKSCLSVDLADMQHQNWLPWICQSWGWSHESISPVLKLFMVVLMDTCCWWVVWSRWIIWWKKRLFWGKLGNVFFSKKIAHGFSLSFFNIFLSICPPPELLPVLGPREWWRATYIWPSPVV